MLVASEYASSLNLYIDQTKPWAIEDPDELRAVLSEVGVGLRILGIVLYPFFTVKMTELLERIGCSEDIDLLIAGQLSVALDPAIEQGRVFKILEK